MDKISYVEFARGYQAHLRGEDAVKDAAGALDFASGYRAAEDGWKRAGKDSFKLGRRYIIAYESDGLAFTDYATYFAEGVFKGNEWGAGETEASKVQFYMEIEHPFSSQFRQQVLEDSESL